jgi:hypothetical protein
MWVLLFSSSEDLWAKHLMFNFTSGAMVHHTGREKSLFGRLKKPRNGHLFFLKSKIEFLIHLRK